MDVSIYEKDGPPRPKSTRELPGSAFETLRPPRSEKAEPLERRPDGVLNSFELVSCIEEALEDWAQQFPRIRILRSYEENFPDPLIGDAVSLFALLQSMLRRIASDSASRTIYVTLKRDHLFSSDTHVAFSLQIEAQPIAASDRELMDRESGDVESNWSRQLIQKLGGEMRLEQTAHSALKLTARLRFPKGMMPSADLTSALEGIRVLVVDDDSMSRMLTAAMLRSLKAQVVTARHGAEAIELAKQQTFDMVFLDIEMPVMDGVSTCQLLRQIPSYEQVPVLALTSHEQEHQHAYYLEHGMQEVMVKPVGKPTMIEAAQRYLRRAASVKSVRRDLLRLSNDEALQMQAAGDAAHAGEEERGSGPRWVAAEQLKDAFADSREVLELCVTVFGKRYPVLLNEIDRAVKGVRLQDVARAAHEMKGMLANLWVPGLSALAADIEDWALEGKIEQSAERVETLWQSIPVGLDEMQDILKAWPADDFRHPPPG